MLKPSLGIMSASAATPGASSLTDLTQYNGAAEDEGLQKIWLSDRRGGERAIWALSEKREDPGRSVYGEVGPSVSLLFMNEPPRHGRPSVFHLLLPSLIPVGR